MFALARIRNARPASVHQQGQMNHLVSIAR